MNKKLFIYVFALSLFFLNNCGFSPKYAGYITTNFIIVIEKIDGDRDFNNLIKSKLRRYQNNENTKLQKFNIDINSEYKKITVARNTKGDATKYDLQITATFTISGNNTKRVVKFDENFKIDKIEDTVEENNYIRIIKGNFAESISEKLILYIQQNK